MAQEMDTLVCDALIDVGAFPEVAPPPLKGATCVLGQHYYLPQGQLTRLGVGYTVPEEVRQARCSSSN